MAYCSSSGSSVYGILQARILEWVAIPFFRRSSQPRDRTQVSWVSCIAGRFLTIWATRESQCLRRPELIPSQLQGCRNPSCVSLNIYFLSWLTCSSLEKEMATHSSILAWKIAWMEEPGRLLSMGSQRVGHDWMTSLSLVHVGARVYKLRAFGMNSRGNFLSFFQPPRKTCILENCAAVSSASAQIAS